MLLKVARDARSTHTKHTHLENLLLLFRRGFLATFLGGSGCAVSMRAFSAVLGREFIVVLHVGARQSNLEAGNADGAVVIVAVHAKAAISVFAGVVRVGLRCVVVRLGFGEAHLVGIGPHRALLAPFSPFWDESGFAFGADGALIIVIFAAAVSVEAVVTV